MFLGEGAHRRWGLGGGKARGRRALPLGGSVWSWGGRRRLAGVEQGRRPAADCGGAAPAVRGGGERVWELHGAMRKLYWGSIWVEEGRRAGLHGELGRQWWGGDAVLAQGLLGSAW